MTIVGDGDCFYRCDVALLASTWLVLTLFSISPALGFAYVECLINSQDRDFAVASSLSMLASTKDTLDKAGIERLVYEDFYDEFTFLIENITRPDPQGLVLNSDRLLTAFQSPESKQHSISVSALK